MKADKEVISGDVLDLGEREVEYTRIAVMGNTMALDNLPERKHVNRK